MATKKAEQGIRDYLESLGQDAKPIVDKEGVKALKAEIRGTSDPIAKLRLLSQLSEAEAGTVPDTSGLLAVFVAEAKPWADAEGIPAESFQALGVPDDVLKQAGFKLSATVTRPARASGGKRGPALQEEAIKAAIAKVGSPWTLSAVAEELDTKPATLRNWLDRLGATKQGEAPKPEGKKGRAETLYAIA